MRTSSLRFGATLLAATLLSACDTTDTDPGPIEVPTPRAVTESDYVVTATGLKYFDFVEGQGEAAQVGQLAVVHYNGWFTNDQLFDSSIQRGQPISFLLGRGQVIAGWEEGIAGMKVGGQRQLVIPPALAYGEQGTGGIPPNTTLIFEVELIDVGATAAQR